MPCVYGDDQGLGGAHQCFQGSLRLPALADLFLKLGDHVSLVGVDLADLREKPLSVRTGIHHWPEQEHLIVTPGQWAQQGQEQKKEQQQHGGQQQQDVQQEGLQPFPKKNLPLPELDGCDE